MGLKVRQSFIVSIFLVLLFFSSACYIFGIASENTYNSIFFLLLIIAFAIFSVLSYMLTKLPLFIKNVMLSLLIVVCFIIVLDFIESTFKFNANSSIYFIYMIITLLFGTINGIISVIYGAILFLTKATLYSKPLERYIFYSAVSLFSVIVVGLIVAYEKKLIERLKNKISTLQQAPLEFNLTNNIKESQVAYSEIISDEGLKKEKTRLTRLLNERLFDIVETIRSTIHPFTVILYLKDSNAQYRGREILSSSEWISMDKPLTQEDPYIGWILKNKKSMILNEIQGEIKGLPYYVRNEGIKSFLAVPTIRENDVIGIICVDSLEVQAFTDEHAKLLTVISNQIIDLLDNIELQYKLRYDMYEKGAMYSFVRTLSHSIDTIDIAKTSLNEILRITNAKSGFFAIKDEHNKFRIVYTQNIDKELTDERIFIDTEPILDGIAENRTPSITQITVPQLKTLHPFLYSLYTPDKSIKYAIIIPLLGKTEELGIIILYMENTINERISIILETLINQISISLYNSILFDKLNKLAITDGLTSLHNHRHFQEYLEVEVKEAIRYNKALSLLMIDIDHFKLLNDKYGHPQGDRVLKKLSDIIMQTIRDVDYAARYGGEEFCVVLPNTDSKGAYKITERLRRNIESLVLKTDAGENIKFTISTGISSIPEDAKNKEEILLHSDKALYYSKENGRNKTTIYGNIKFAPNKQNDLNKQ
ncbi:MAG: diguanylate cyclase [bacterium]